MPFVIQDANLPATLTAQPMTDEEFVAFCAEHPDLNFEMTAEGELIVMPPTYSDIGASSSIITAGRTRRTETPLVLAPLPRFRNRTEVR
jgi:hypothetical protein